MLNLHSGGTLIDLDVLQALPTPEATATHHPIPHYDLVNMAKYALSYFGHEVVEEHHAIDKEGARYFGLLSLKSEYGDYCDSVGLRNSHDKKFPIGISFGAKVFVCSNLSFCGDHVIKRKHTKGAKFALPSLVAEVVEPLKEQRLLQARTFESYHHTHFNDELVDHLIMTLYRKGIINVTRIEQVLNAYDNPPHDWGEKTAWRFFNATTYALTGRVAENPAATSQLHDIIDAFCTPADHNQLALEYHPA